MEVLGPRSSSFAGQGGRFSSGPRKFTVYRLWVDLGFRGFRVWGGGGSGMSERSSYATSHQVIVALKP